jgi:hypothetical protein
MRLRRGRRVKADGNTVTVELTQREARRQHRKAVARGWSGRGTLAEAVCHLILCEAARLA